MGMMEILEQVSAVSEQMVQFMVTKEELLLLQATILVNAGTSSTQGVRLLSAVSGLPCDSPFLSPLFFFCPVLLLFLPFPSSDNSPFPAEFCELIQLR